MVITFTVSDTVWTKQGRRGENFSVIWLKKDVSRKNGISMIAMERDNPAFSYFYCFNFNVYKLGDNWQRTGTG